MEREEKATAVEAGNKFMELWIAAAGEHTAHVYPHILVAHLPNQIRDLPMDPWYFQTQCLEHKHKFRKMDSFVTNHHAPKPLAERKSDVVGYYRNGKWVGGKEGRMTGPCRSFQLSVVNDYFRNAMATAESVQHQWEKNRLARQRRNQLKCNQLLAANATAQSTVGRIMGQRQNDAEAARQLAEVVDCDDQDQELDGSEDEEDDSGGPYFHGR